MARSVEDIECALETRGRIHLLDRLGTYCGFPLRQLDHLRELAVFDGSLLLGNSRKFYVCTPCRTLSEAK